MTDYGPPLQLGDSGEGVVLLQVRLYGLGLYRKVPDGTFDMETETAVRDLQYQFGQDYSGEVDDDTWQAIVRLEQQYGIQYQYASPYDALNQIQYDLQRAGGQRSPDGQWEWDGFAWQPAAGEALGAGNEYSDYAGQVSPDGAWRWDGYAWQPADAGAGEPDRRSSYAVADSYAGQLSPDGAWRWDGTDWQPA